MPRPRLKHLLRISLRMVFVVTIFLCIWLGYQIHEVKNQKEAVAWVKAHGGTDVRFGWIVPSSVLI